jgi:hypothetical protein
VASIEKKALGDLTEEDAKAEGGYSLNDFKAVWKQVHTVWNPKCGQIVKPKSLQFLLGDNTDEIIASFSPTIMNRPSEGMIIVAQGLLGENEEFLVYRWSLPSDTKVGTTSGPQLQSFFTSGTSPPTTSSPPVTSQPTTSGPPVTNQSVTSQSVTSPLVTSTSPPVTSTSSPVTLMCDQCNAGPFANQLALTGHKSAANLKKVLCCMTRHACLQGSV